MRFLETRNIFMEELGWSRRIATLAARIVMGVDTSESIASTPSFRGKPLLTHSEYVMIAKGVLKLVGKELDELKQ